MSDKKMYDILGHFRNQNPELKKVEEAVKSEPVYEEVEAKGSIMEAIKNLGEKFAMFKEAKAKPDFLDVDGDGNKKEPFKKAVKDKKAVKEGQGPYELHNPKHPKFKANYEKYKAKHPDCTLAEFVAAMKKREAKMNEGKFDEPAAPDADAIAKRKRLQAIKDRQEDERGSYGSEKSNVRKVAGKAYGGSAQKDAPETDDLDEAGYSAKAGRAGKDIGKPGKNFSKIAKDAAKRYGSKERGEKVAGAVLNKLRHGVNEGADQEKTIQSPKGEIVLIQREYDMDNTPEQRTQVYAPAGMSSGEVAHYINAEVYPSDEDGSSYQYIAMLPTFGALDEEYKSPFEPDPQARALKDVIRTAQGPSGGSLTPDQIAQIGQMSTAWNKKDANTNYRTQPGQVRLTGKNTQPAAAAVNSEVDEVAPPGAKAERMVKHIKKGYAKDGKLTNKEKAIAYATAWKAHNKGQVEENVQFGDKVKNSTPNWKKAKPMKIKESRMIQEGDYYYESIGKALAEKNPNLNTAGSDFVAAVRQEMVAQGMKPNQARNILMMDEDFLMDVATSYGHYCKELAECGAPMNSFVGGAEELDEIAKLAGLPARQATCEGCGMVESSCACSHEALDEAADQEKTIDTPKGEIVLIQREYDMDNTPEQRTQVYAPAGMSSDEVAHYINAEVMPSDEEGSSYQYVAMLPTFGALDEVSAGTLKSYLGKNYRSQEEHQQNIEDTPFGSSKEWRDDAQRSADKLKQRRKGEIVAKHKLLKKGELDEAADQEKTIDTPKGEIVLIQREYDMDNTPEQRTQVYAPAGMSAKEVSRAVGAEVFPSDEEGSSYQYVAMLPTFGQELSEEEMETEGNEFSGALAKAKAAGAKDFEVGGKRYTVKEDATITVSATLEDDAIEMLRKLAGMIQDPSGVANSEISVPGPTPADLQAIETGPEVEVAEDGPNIVNAKPRKNSVLNTPREEYAASDITTKGGTGYDRNKKTYRGEWPGDNPMDAYGRDGTQVKEEALWKSYENMIETVKK